jgi:hypothetical protein
MIATLNYINSSFGAYIVFNRPLSDTHTKKGNINMSIFDIEEDVVVEAAQDFDGKRTLDTNLYAGKLKMVYLDQSKGGANSVNLQIDTNGKTSNFTEYVTSGKEKGCKNFYIDKAGKKKLLPGMQAMNELSVVVTGKDLKDQTIEEKVIKVWDYDAKKELPVKRKVITSLCGKDIELAILEIQENKYSDPSQAITKNEIVKVIHVGSQLTLAEKEAGKTEAVWAPKWAEKNAGVMKDTFKAPEPTEGAAVEFDDEEDEDIFND